MDHRKPHTVVPYSITIITGVDAILRKKQFRLVQKRIVFLFNKELNAGHLVFRRNTHKQLLHLDTAPTKKELYEGRKNRR